MKHVNKKVTDVCTKIVEEGSKEETKAAILEILVSKFTKKSDNV